VPPSEFINKTTLFLLQLFGQPNTSNFMMSDREDGSVTELSAALKSVDITDITEKISRWRKTLTSDGNESEKLEAVTGVRRLLSLISPPIDDIIDAGFIPILIDLLTVSQDTRMKTEACWALTNIAAGDTAQTYKLMLSSDIVKLSLELLNEQSRDIIDQTLWLIGNLTGTDVYCRDVYLQANVTQKLIDLYQADTPPATVLHITWIMSNLNRNKPSPKYSQTAPMIHLISNIFHRFGGGNITSSMDIIENCLWALSHFTDGPNERLELVLNTPEITRIVLYCMTFDDQKIKVPALRVVGNLVTGSDVHTQIVIDSGVLGQLEKLIQDPRSSIRREACWALSNICAGTRSQISQIIDSGLIQILVNICHKDKQTVYKEAMYSLTNATSGANNNDLQRLVDLGVLEVLCKRLRDTEAKIIQVALEGIDNVCRVGSLMNPIAGMNLNAFVERVERNGGRSVIQGLVHHYDIDVSSKADEIVNNWFVDSDTEADPERER
jgi:hypothetical protein